MGFWGRVFLPTPSSCSCLLNLSAETEIDLRLPYLRFIPKSSDALFVVCCLGFGVVTVEGSGLDLQPAGWRSSPYDSQLIPTIRSYKADRMVSAQDVVARNLFMRSHHAVGYRCSTVLGRFTVSCFGRPRGAPCNQVR
jgi:hypothetical protein